MQKKPKTLIFFLSFFMIFLLVNTCFVNTVNASQTLICNFDDIASGLDSGTSGYFDFENIDTANSFETSTTSYASSPNSLKMIYNSDHYYGGWCNLTQSYSYIGKINFSLLMDVSSLRFNISFYHNNNMVIQLYVYLDDIFWVDVSSGDKKLVESSEDTRYYIVITHNSTNQFNITILNSVFAIIGGNDYGGSYASNYTTFDSIYFNANTGSTMQTFYFDNFYIDTDVFYETETPSSGEISDMCLFLNNLHIQEYTSSSHYRLGLQYLTPMSITVTGFKILLVKPDGDPVLLATDYTLELNDYTNYGIADSITLYYTDVSNNQYYWVEWTGLNAVFLDEKPTFFIESTRTGIKFVIPTTSNSGSQTGESWQIYTYDAHLTEGNLPNMYYTNLVYAIPFCITYLTSSIPTTPPGFNDLITVPIGQLYTNSTIPISYWLSTLATQNSITIYKSGSLVYTYDVFEYTGIITYAFTSSGSYTLNIYRVGENNVSSITVSVIDYPSDNWIYCLPEPSTIGQNYFIYYNYSNAGGSSGALYLYEYDSRFYTIGFYSGVTPQLLAIVNANTTGVLNYIGNKEGAHYIILGTYTNQSVLTASYIHYIRYSFTTENIKVKFSTVALGTLPPTYENPISIDNQVVDWVHYRIGYVVKIYDNDILVYDVSNKLTGSYQYNVTGIGLHNVSLKVITANGSIEIDNTSYNVVGEYVPPDSDFPDFPIPDIGGTVYGYIFGFVVILLFSMIPLGFAISTDTAMRDIPIYIYLIFTSIGLCLTVVLGWIPIWIPFFIVVVLIILLLIKYLQDKDLTSK